MEFVVNVAVNFVIILLFFVAIKAIIGYRFPWEIKPSSKEKVYVLEHKDESLETFVIGIFSSREKAIEYMQQYDCESDFLHWILSEEIVDEDHAIKPVSFFRRNATEYYNNQCEPRTIKYD